MRKVPKLRFKEFSDEWEEKKLEDIGEINPKSKSIPKKFVYIDLESVVDGQLKEKKIIEKEEAPSRAKRLVEKNDILYQMVRPYQQNNLYFSFNDELDYVASTGYAQIRTFYHNNSMYVYHLMHTKKFLDKVLERCTGTSYPAINSEDLSNISIKISKNINEQEKIANFLSSIDKKISLTEEKLELFREYKKGVMQKIFSQELRFKDSDDNDYPEWEEKKLEEVAECLDNLRKPLNSNEREKIKGSIPYYGANGIQGYINNYIFNEELVLLAEDGGNFDDYLTKPIAQYVQGKSWINNHAHVLKGKKVLKTKFLYFSLVHKDIRSFINGTSRSKLNKSSMLNIIILLPALEEQEKIADFLSSIDSKIENIEKELEGLKEFKKGLLQQMFV